MKPLTIESFRAWLQEQPEDKEFRTCNGMECPLAVYVNEGASVGVRDIKPEKWPVEPRIPLPGWARLFVHRVDNTEGEANTTVRTPEVLNILKDVEEWLVRTASEEGANAN